MIFILEKEKKNKILSQPTRPSREETTRRFTEHTKSVTYIARNTSGGYEVDPRSRETLKLPRG